MQQIPTQYKIAADRVRLLSHPARLQILDELRRGEACVCHLQTVLGRPQAPVSQQLRVLREADLLESGRDGLNALYRIPDMSLLHRLTEMLGHGRAEVRTHRPGR